MAKGRDGGGKVGGVVCLDLRRSGGCVRYADLMFDSLSPANGYHFISRFRKEPVTSTHNRQVRVPTYTNKFQFVASSVTVVPFLMLFFIYLRLRGIQTIYAPYQHFWNPFLLLAGRFLGMQVVATIHEPPPREAGMYSMLVRWRTRICCELASKLVFLTEFVRGIMEKEGYVRTRHDSVVLPHGIIAPEGLRRGSREHPCREGRSFRLLFFGRVTANKGIERLFSAYSQLGETNCELTVMGRWEMSRNDMDIPREGVTLVDKYVDEGTLVEAFNNHSALVLPYSRATQSGVITLGIAARMPMIVTDVGGLNEQVEAGETALVIPPAKDALVEAIERLIQDPNLYESMSRRLVELEQDRFSWERLACQLWEFCKM